MTRRIALIAASLVALSGCVAGHVGTDPGGEGIDGPADGNMAGRECTGCVDPETGGCVRGASDVACGTDGEACVACADNEVCSDDRVCVARTGCGPGNCPGCCMGDVCMAFDRPEACGSDGASCVACGSGEACVDGECVAEASCGPSSCAGCCGDDGTCHEGSDVVACGASGGLCEVCPAGWSCDDGACRPPCEEWCGGCCDADGVCHDGATDASCGDAGSACVDCGDGAVCTDGACVELSCAESCDGCCLGEACLGGELGGACGAGGAACVDCGPAFTCGAAGTCEVDPFSRWDLVAVRASFSPFNPSGSLWDAGSSGRADAFATAEANAAGGATYAGRTGHVSDTSTPIWVEDVLTDVPARDLRGGVTIRVRDHDVFSRDDDIGWCWWVPQHDHFGVGSVTLTCPARTSDPLTVVTEMVVRLERH